ncbi:MAG: hypothetical protein ACK535_17400, partial [Cyanobacteriota bacterium]
GRAVTAAGDAHRRGGRGSWRPPAKLALEHVDEVLVAPLGDAVLDRPHLPGHLEVVAELDREPLARLLLSRVNPLGRLASIKLAGEVPQVVVGDNLGAATRKVSHPAGRSMISTGFS